MNAALIVLLLLAPLAAAAEIVEYPGNPDVLPDERFVRVVSEEASPVQQTYIKARDGVYTRISIFTFLSLTFRAASTPLLMRV